MNIGVYDPYLDDNGGGEKYLITLAECLSEDNDVFVFWDNVQDLESVGERFNINLENIKA